MGFGSEISLTGSQSWESGRIKAVGVQRKGGGKELSGRHQCTANGKLSHIDLGLKWFF